MTTRAFAAAVGLAAVLAASAAWPQTTLRPVSPQPAPESLTQGLEVSYAYGGVRMLSGAAAALQASGEPGPPLIGLDYPDGGDGAKVMTSTASRNVSAQINGYLRFDQPGVWRLQFHNNDGMRVRIGGETVYLDDSRTPCDTVGWTEVTVPQAGWYAVDILFFQRLSSSCAMLRWERPDGVTQWAPPEVWAYQP
ncbi:MAG: PA14 domain-containing protein [Pseudomonadota bacterium]